MAFLSIL